MLKTTFNKYKNNELLRSVAVYTTLSFVIKGISFLITPFFTHYITPEQFGNINLFLTSIIFLNPIISISTNSILNSFYNDSKEIFGNKISTFILFSFFSTLILILLIIIFKKHLWQINPSLFILISLPCITFLSFLFELVILISRNDSSKRRVFFATILKTIIEISFSIYFIIYLGMADKGRLLAYCLSILLTSTWAILILYKRYNLSFNFNFNYILIEYKFWISLIIGFFIILTFSVFDKFLVSSKFSKFEFGNYSFAFQLGSILFSITNPIQLTLQNELVKDLRNITGINILKKLYTSFFAFVIMGIVMYLILWYIFVNFIHSSYINSLPFIKWTILLFVLFSIFNSYMILLNYLKKSKIILLTGFSSILLLLPLQFYITDIYPPIAIVILQINYFLFLIIILNKIISRIIKYNNN